jgi:hypothetical protein
MAGCLDESMNVWFNKYTPGFMVIPQNPHPFGNEYHTICDGHISDQIEDKDTKQGNPTMWHVELQEGKDCPAGAGAKRYNKHGKTPGLMCCMHSPIARTGKACTMDSGFCILKGIVELKHLLDVFAQALIKKRG